MEKDNYKTDVVFRKFKGGEIIALLVHECCGHNGGVVSYMHIGQHSDADYNHVLSMTKIATEEEFDALKKEMENIGYQINPVKKQNYKKWLADYRRVRGLE